MICLNKSYITPKSHSSKIQRLWLSSRYPICTLELAGTLLGKNSYTVPLRYKVYMHYEQIYAFKLTRLCECVCMFKRTCLLVQANAFARSSKCVRACTNVWRRMHLHAEANVVACGDKCVCTQMKNVHSLYLASEQ